MTGTNESSDFETFRDAFADSEPRMPVTVTANTVMPGEGAVDTVTDRQERIEEFEQATFSGASVLLVGAGGLGCQIGRGLVRKGVGELVICDEDHVEVSNLSRQLFGADDVGENKAVALARNLVDEGTCGTAVTGIPLHFEDAVARGYDFGSVDLVIVAPDNDAARFAVAASFLDEVPVIVVGLGMDAMNGYVYVQEPGSACFKCWRGENTGGGAPCQPTPAALDPAMTMAGIVLYAVDSALMDRYAEWDLYEVFLSGVPAPTARTVERDADCPLCSTTEVEN